MTRDVISILRVHGDPALSVLSLHSRSVHAEAEIRVSAQEVHSRASKEMLQTGTIPSREIGDALPGFCPQSGPSLPRQRLALFPRRRPLERPRMTASAGSTAGSPAVQRVDEMTNGELFPHAVDGEGRSAALARLIPTEANVLA